MTTQPLDIVPLPVLLMIFGIALTVVMEGGYRFGKWRHESTPDEREQPVGAMVASILGLVALVLGFTFGLAASRFDARRMAVLEEANAIGTTYLRARLLPEPQRSEVAKRLQEYVDARIAGTSTDKVDEAVASSEELHERLWEQATAAAADKSNAIMTSLFIQSLNDVIDLHAKRLLVGIHSRIPVVIWAGLFGLSMVGLTAVGYQAGLTTTRRSPAMLALVLAFSVVLLLIADLDRGQEGLLRVSQRSMVDLQRSMRPGATGVPPVSIAPTRLTPP